MNNKSVIIILLIIIVVVIVLITNNNKDNNLEVDNFVDSSEVNNSDVGSIDGGTYIAYSEAAAKVAAMEGEAVIFFHAGWCPTCRSLDKRINSEKNKIPASVTILRADYDAEDDLKRKYGVTSQHTLVLVDENLNGVKINRGAASLDDILNFIFN